MGLHRRLYAPLGAILALCLVSLQVVHLPLLSPRVATQNCASTKDPSPSTVFKKGEAMILVSYAFWEKDATQASSACPLLPGARWCPIGVTGVTGVTGQRTAAGRLTLVCNIHSHLQRDNFDFFMKVGMAPHEKLEHISFVFVIAPGPCTACSRWSGR